MLLRFKRNTAYKGTDYGPDYAEEVTEVDEPWATQFLAQGRAVPADVKPKRIAGRSRYPGKGDVQVADPEAAHQDPRPPLEARPLPEGFPGYHPLRELEPAVRTFGELFTYLEDHVLEDVPGIGPATAGKARKALQEVRPT